MPLPAQKYVCQEGKFWVSFSSFTVSPACKPSELYSPLPCYVRFNAAVNKELHVLYILSVNSSGSKMNEEMLW